MKNMNTKRCMPQIQQNGQDLQISIGLEDYVKEKGLENILVPFNESVLLCSKMIPRTLSEGFSQIRVDLYLIDNTIYFGELTFSSNAGRM